MPDDEELFLRIIAGLDEGGVLQKVVLIGSWALRVYQTHFDNDPLHRRPPALSKSPRSSLRTDVFRHYDIGPSASHYLLQTMRILIPLLVVLLASCTTIPVDESILLQPRRSVTPETFERLGIDGYSLAEHSFEADDGTVLNGWFVSRNGDTDRNERVTVVLFGGNGFYLVHSIPFLQLYAALDVDVFMWDYRGYGLSGGQATLALMREDALAAIDFARDDLGAAGPMIAHGHSIGTFVATYAAEERTLDALVLESPATNADHWLQSAIPGFVRTLVNIEVAEGLAELDNLPTVRRFTSPTLFAVGEDDFVTPPAMAELLFETSEASWKLLYTQPEGDHNSLPRDPGFRDAFRGLIEELR